MDRKRMLVAGLAAAAMAPAGSAQQALSAPLVPPPIDVRRAPDTRDVAPPIRMAEELRLPFAPPTGVPLRYRIANDYEGPNAPVDSLAEQTLIFGTLPGGDLQVTMVTHTIAVAGKTYTPESELHELPLVGDAALLLGPIRFRLSPQGAIKRIENWDEYRENLRLMPAIAVAGAETEREREAVRRAMGAETLPQPNPEAAAMASTPLWRQLFGYGGSAVVPGEKRAWSYEQPFLGGAAKLVIATELTVTPLPDGTTRLERTVVTDPVGFAEAAAPGWELNEQIGMAEAARLRVNVDWMKDITETVKTFFLIDQAGTILEGTLTRSGKREGRDAGLAVTTFELLD